LSNRRALHVGRRRPTWCHRPPVWPKPDHRIKVYLALPDQPPTPIQDSPIAEAAKTIIPVALEKGINDFSVAIVDPLTAETSALVRYVWTQSAQARSRRRRTTHVNGKAVTIRARPQARTTLLARNDASGSSIGGPPALTALSRSIWRSALASTRS
jgi:hypothetical protein